MPVHAFEEPSVCRRADFSSGSILPLFPRECRRRRSKSIEKFWRLSQDQKDTSQGNGFRALLFSLGGRQPRVTEKNDSLVEGCGHSVKILYLHSQGLEEINKEQEYHPLFLSFSFNHFDSSKKFSQQGGITEIRRHYINVHWFTHDQNCERNKNKKKSLGRQLSCKFTVP